MVDHIIILVGFQFPFAFKNHPEPWQDSLRMEGQDIFLLSADHLKERLEALKDEVEQTVRHFQHKVRGA